MKLNNPKIIVVMPAYNAAKTLKKTVDDIPGGIVDEIILVDDKSTDETVAIAKKLSLTVICHENNLGYGGNQKTCYKTALAHGADIVIMLHPDYQYEPKLISHFVQSIKDDKFDIVLGSRIKSKKEVLDGGMPAYKYYANRFLTLIENIATGQNLSEWHTGYRAFSRGSLEKIDFMGNSNDFIFDTQILFQAVRAGFKIGEVSVPTKYFPDASCISFKRSLVYGFRTLCLAFAYGFHRMCQKWRSKNN